MKIPFFNSKKSSILTFEKLKELLQTNDLKKIKREKENGADFQTVDSYDGINILEYYIQNIENFKYDKNEIIKFLIDCKLDINHKANKRANENSALHLSIYNKDLDLVKILTELNAEIDIQNKYGNTPLQIAVFNYRGEKELKDIIMFLINNGASLEKKNFHDVSPKDHIINVGGGVDAKFNKNDWDLRELL